MRLVQTSGAAPEQYDVYCGDTQVGYLRLRWGHFSAHLHGSGGPIVYMKHIRLVMVYSISMNVMSI